MTKYLHARGIRIFDFAQFAKPLTDAVQANAEALAAQHGLSIDLHPQEELPQGRTYFRRFCASAAPSPA
jgi:hypothetical protein